MFVKLIIKHYLRMKATMNGIIQEKELKIKASNDKQKELVLKMENKRSNLETEINHIKELI